MSRRLSVLLLAVTLVLAACGGGGSSSDGASASPGTGASVGVPAGAELPAGSNVIFGSAWDPATLAVTGRTTRITQGTTPIVAVGRALGPVDGTGVKVRIEAGGTAKQLRAPAAMDNPTSAELFAVDLSGDGLTPGTWIISFVNPDSRILASGFLSITK